MADYLAGFYPEWVDKEENPRQIILDLGKMITNRIPVKLGFQKLNKYDPEYWGLATLLTDEQAEVALKMGVRKPKTMADMVKLTGKSEEELEKILGDMSFMGILEYNWENPTRTKQWVLPMFVPGSAEFTNMNDTILKKYPEMGRFFERMSRLPLEKVTPMVPPGGAGIGMHVIPVEKAIETENQSISVEHISHWLDKYEGKYAASPCSCRKSRLTFDEGCADDPEGWCVAVGDMADYVVETGKGGRYITKEEALEIFRKGEENGFVHQITNIDGADKIFAICNCNINVCYALRTSQLFNTPNLSRSAYVARVEKDDCVACGKCVEVCPAGAVKLGQKLCTKDGKQVEYPKHPLPSEMKWGPHMWDEDYRDNNRINCYETGTSPCKVACPAHIAVQGYIRKAKEGKYREALELIKKDNPFPAICGRICPHKCEDACTRGQIDKGVAIDEIKKFIADKDKNSNHRFIPNKKHDYSMKNMAVIGSGPAGLSCAYYLAVDGYNVTVFEKENKLGGMMTLGIPAFRLEKDVVEAEIDILRELGVKFVTGVEVGKDKTLDELKKEGFDGFYLAIGASAGRKLGVEGEDAKGVILGVDFLKDVALERSEPLHGNVIVIGGGNVAIDVARTAVRCGAQTVNMYSLEQRAEMPALEEEIEEAESENVVINNGYGPKRIVVENGKVVGVEFKKCVSVFNAEGKFAPKYDENDTIIVPADFALVSIGQKIEWGNLLDGTNVKLNKNNTVAVDEFYVTGDKNIIAGGDCVTGPKFAIDAIASGKEGAISLHRAVWPGQTQKYGRDRRVFIELDKDNLELKGYDNVKRQRPLHIKENDGTFKDNRATFTEEQMKAETARCLGCGAAKVDTYMCVGCGQCTTKCKFDAIKLVRNDKTVVAKVYEKLPLEMAKHAIKRVGKIITKPISPKE